MNEKLNQEKKLNISFFFRKPKFPIICDIDGYVIAARSKSGIEKQLSKCDSFEKSRYDVIDVKGEGWSFHPEKMFITPLNMKKRWFKKEIIAMFNNRRNNFSDQTYSEKSISTKRFEIIFKRIVGLLIENP